MKMDIKFMLLFLLFVVLACGISFWAEDTPALYDYRLIHNRDIDNGNPQGNFLFAFATALRINHPAAYDMIDPSAKHHLDEWMNTHQIQRCKSIPHFTSIVSGTKAGSKVGIVCYGHNEYIDFVVDNIVIDDMKVIDWSEVTEEN